MEFVQTKIILYMLIISTGIDFILPWPIFTENPSSHIDLQPKSIERPRPSRQVVQPTWLNDQKEPAVDPIVHVNPKALQEADTIRKSIQDAVDHDFYAVTGEEPNANIAMVTLQPIADFEPAPEATTPDGRNIHHALPPWYQQMQILWQNWSQGLLRGFRG